MPLPANVHPLSEVRRRRNGTTTDRARSDCFLCPDDRLRRLIVSEALGGRRQQVSAVNCNFATRVLLKREKERKVENEFIPSLTIYVVQLLS